MSPLLYTTSAHNLSSLLTGGHHADCTVKCKDVEWHIHRCILCPRSAYFDRALNGDFQEGQTATITMFEEDLYAVEGVLLYLYNYSYPEWPAWTSESTTTPEALRPQALDNSPLETLHESTPCENRQKLVETSEDLSNRSTAPKTQWQTHLGMFKIADKLGLEDLKMEAERRLRSAIEKEWGSSNFHELLEEL